MAPDRPTSLLRCGVAALLLGLTVACGGDSDMREGTQPAPGGTAFTDDPAFVDVPLHPRSDEVGEVQQEDHGTSQSFVVRDASPEDILDFYATELDQHTVVEPPRQVGQDAWRGDWMVDGRRLRVSAVPAPAVDQHEPATYVETQYSLTLYQQGVNPEG